MSNPINTNASAQPTTCLLQYRCGQITREAVGPSFFYYSPTTSAAPLILESRMPENGVIFSDGLEKDFLEFNSGATATITLAPQKGALIV